MNTVVSLFSIAIVIVGQSLCQEKVTCGKLKYPFITTAYGIDKIIPWAALLVDNKANPPKDTAIMPGILVSPSLVVLSGRFFYNESRKSLHVSDLDSNYTVLLGSQEWSNGESQVQRIPVSFISDHPTFGRRNKWSRTNHSIALAHLAYSVQLSERVQPVCIPTMGDKSRIKNVAEFNPTFVMGWSENDTTHYNGFQLKALSRTRCKEFWRHKRTTVDRPSYCAVISQTNDGDYCPSSNVGSFYRRNGSYFLEGPVWGNYKDTEMCTINTTLLVYYLTNETLQWIKNSEICGSKIFTCVSGGICIERSNLCDGKIDCKDSSDEIVSYCTNSDACDIDDLKCQIHGSCVSKTRINDGNKDCPDGEDEPDSFHNVVECPSDGSKCQLFGNHEIGEEKSNSTSFSFGNLVVVGILACVVVIGLTYFYAKVQRMKGQIRNLNKEEIDEFRKGSYQPQATNLPQHSRTVEEYCQQYINGSILANSWKEEYEIPMNHVEIGKELNRGNFGVVYKGKLRSYEPADVSPGKPSVVAVKTYVSTVTVDEFKTLLREVKILAHVGAHENIVSFLGACTGNIKKRKLYLLLELCELGDLLNFLRSHSKSYFERNCKPGGVNLESNETRSGTDHTDLSMKELIKWSSQIANGMDYLEAKNVIHGDLASRNILLNKEFNAKISDFGLARELNNSDIYVKSPREILPWRLLALESFTMRIYSHKTDVWAYGVTIWEIFSLGQSPYGESCFNSDFVMELQAGFRLPCPPLASKELYDVLLKTWNEDPDLRPTFKDLQITMRTMQGNEYLNVVELDLVA